MAKSKNHTSERGQLPGSVAASVELAVLAAVQGACHIACLQELAAASAEAGMHHRRSLSITRGAQDSGAGSAGDLAITASPHCVLTFSCCASGALQTTTRAARPTGTASSGQRSRGSTPPRGEPGGAAARRAGAAHACRWQREVPQGRVPVGRLSNMPWHQRVGFVNETLSAPAVLCCAVRRMDPKFLRNQVRAHVVVGGWNEAGCWWWACARVRVFTGVAPR